MQAPIDALTEMDFQSGVILNIDKPAGLTSFGVVKAVRRMVKVRKVGHAGTLDPMATGVLLVCTGRATKRVSGLMGLEKEYEGVITLGAATDTDDKEGRVLFEKEVPNLTYKQIAGALKEFEGEIMQVPPMFSALKHQGERLYKLARKGEVVQREPRPVTVHEACLMQWDSPNIHVRIRCSRGTYIRSIARDMGEKLNTGGYLKNLRRTRIGEYAVDDAYHLTDLEKVFLR